MKYSLPPSRKTRRVKVTSLKASSTPAAFKCSESTLPTVSETSAMPNGLRASVPLKMTSAISPPRRALADCSPNTQRTASDIFDLPQPFGPTIAETPGRKFSVVLSANDLKPSAVKLFKYMTCVRKRQKLTRVKSKNHHIVGSKLRRAQLIEGSARWVAFARFLRLRTSSGLGFKSKDFSELGVVCRQPR